MILYNITEKVTIEIERMKHICGYGKMNYLDETSESVLDKLIEWSRGNSHKIYKHRIKYIEEKNDTYGNYFMDGGLKQYGEQLGPSMEIPYCDLVCYLDIYYQ